MIAHLDATHTRIFSPCADEPGVLAQAKQNDTEISSLESKLVMGIRGRGARSCTICLGSVLVEVPFFFKGGGRGANAPESLEGFFLVIVFSLVVVCR